MFEHDEMALIIALDKILCFYLCYFKLWVFFPDIKSYPKHIIVH